MAEKGFRRKLSAILSADVEGYSRLMGEDTEAAYHAQYISSSHNRYLGP
jgi:hypothetical protein